MQDDKPVTMSVPKADELYRAALAVTQEATTNSASLPRAKGVSVPPDVFKRLQKASVAVEGQQHKDCDYLAINGYCNKCGWFEGKKTT